MLFSNEEEAIQIPAFCSQLRTCANYEDSLLYMQNNSPMFENYEAFLKECFKEQIAEESNELR